MSGCCFRGLALSARTWLERERVWLSPINLDTDCVCDIGPLMEQNRVPFRLTPCGKGFELRPQDQGGARGALGGLPGPRGDQRDPGLPGNPGPNGELLRRRFGELHAVFWNWVLHTPWNRKPL